MTNSPIPPPPPGAPQRKTGRITVLVGFCIMIAPVVIAMVGSWVSSTSAYDEGEGWGAAFWLLFFSVPAGLVIMLVGGIIGMIRTLLRRK